MLSVMVLIDGVWYVAYSPAPPDILCHAPGGMRLVCIVARSLVVSVAAVTWTIFLQSL